MKKWIIIPSVLIVVALGAYVAYVKIPLPPGAWGKEQNGVAVSLQSSKQTYAEGEPIPLSVRVKNCSFTPSMSKSPFRPSCMRFIVFGGNGARVMPYRKGKNWFSVDTQEMFQSSTKLWPGDTLKLPQYQLTDWYDLPPGGYFVMVLQSLSEDWKYWGISNAIHIRVVGKMGKAK